MLQTGSRFGRYLVKDLIGRGATGAVYRARDTRLGRDVALKILRQNTQQEPRRAGVPRLVLEGRAGAAINHPNAVAVYDAGAHEGIAYLTMELIEGHTLRTYVNERPPIAQCLLWLLDVARALEAAHACGIVHRDVKPENILVRRDGVLKVVDFGIAREVPHCAPTTATSSLSAAIVGTPQYMAPEQLRNEAVDGRCDQFAWGVVAYELLSGRLPWRLRGVSAAFEMLRGHEAIALADHCPDLPAGIEAIVTRSLRLCRDQRFDSARELVLALSAASGLEDSPSAPEPTAPLFTSESRSADTESDTSNLSYPIAIEPVELARRGRAAFAGLVGFGILLLAMLGSRWIGAGQAHFGALRPTESRLEATAAPPSTSELVALAHASRANRLDQPVPRPANSATPAPPEPLPAHRTPRAVPQRRRPRFPPPPTRDVETESKLRDPFADQH
jgi:serine/threonine protein kinase